MKTIIEVQMFIRFVSVPIPHVLRRILELD